MIKNNQYKAGSMKNKEVDMYYRLTWDTEPTDEQLAVIMEEVKEDAIQQSKRIKKKLLDDIEEEFLKSKAVRDNLQ